MNHSFDTRLAEKYGIESAILLQNIFYWIQKNKANNKHFYDGQYWTYNSSKAFAEQFTYMTQSTIKRNLQSLVKEGVLIKGEYNSNPYDRTAWFAMSSELYESIEGCKMDNGQLKSDPSITYINTNIKNNKDWDSENFSKENETVLVSQYDFSKCKLKESHPHRQLIESGLRLFSFFKKKTQNKDLDTYTLKEWLIPLKFLKKNYTQEQIEELVEYANADKFWGAIVLNTDSLQRNFEKIKAQLTKSLK